MNKNKSDANKVRPNKGMLEAIAKAGSQEDLGRLIDRAQGAISYMLHNGPTPEMAVAIERAVRIKGLRFRLRPDIFGKGDAARGKSRSQSIRDSGSPEISGLRSN